MDEVIYKRIESYLDNQLPEGEHSEFEQEIKENPELQELVHLLQEMRKHFSGEIPDVKASQEFTSAVREYIQTDEAMQLKDSLAEYHMQYSQVDTPGVKRRSQLWAVAAAIVALVAVGLYLFFPKSSLHELYAEYYSQDDLPSMITRNGNTTLKSDAIQAFNNEDYVEAIPLFKQYLTQEKEPDALIFLYLGISYMEQNNPKEALEPFENMIASNSLDRPRAIWFKALAYIQLGEKDQAKATLHTLIQEGSGYKSKEAKALLKQL